MKIKNTQKGFIVPLIIAIIAVLAIGAGVYTYHKEKQQQAATASSTVSDALDLTATTSQTEVVATTTVATSSLSTSIKTDTSIKASLPAVPLNSTSAVNKNITWNVFRDPVGFSFNYPNTWTVKSDVAINGGTETTLYNNGIAQVIINTMMQQNIQVGSILQTCSTGVGTHVETMANNTFTISQSGNDTSFCVSKGNKTYTLMNIGNTLLNNQIISSLEVNS